MPEMHYGNGEKQRTMPPPDVQRNTYQQLWCWLHTYWQEMLWWLQPRNKSARSSD
jgi:hypothetical protein